MESRQRISRLTVIGSLHREKWVISYKFNKNILTIFAELMTKFYLLEKYNYNKSIQIIIILQ